MKAYIDLVNDIHNSGDNLGHKFDKPQVTRVLLQQWSRSSDQGQDVIKVVQRYATLPLANKILAMSTAQSSPESWDTSKLNMLVPVVNYSWSIVSVVRVDDLFDVVGRYMSEQSPS